MRKNKNILKTPQVDDYQEFVIDHTKTGDHYANDDELREKYAERSIKMIEHVIERAEAGEPYDTLMFLDKSARPLAWMMRALWPLVLNDEQENIEMPEMKFVNIDREPWRINKATPLHDIRTGELNNFKGITPSQIDGLRMMFAKRALNKENGESPRDVPTHLDGKNVLIIDEIEDSGDTTWVAKRLFSEAFGESGAEFTSKAWMRWRGDGTHKPEKPIWYTKTGNSGRLIKGQVPPGHKNASKKSSLIDSSHQFLSVPDRKEMKVNLSEDEQRQIDILSIKIDQAESEQEREELRKQIEAIQYTGTDPRGIRLRKEMAKLAVDVASGKYIPIIMNPNLDLMPFETEKERNQLIIDKKASKK